MPERAGVKERKRRRAENGVLGEEERQTSLGMPEQGQMEERRIEEVWKRRTKGV